MNSISSVEKGKLSRTKIHLYGVCVVSMSSECLHVCRFYLFRTMHEFAHLISRLCCVFSQVSPLPRVESTSLVQPRCNVASIFLLGTVHHCFANECGVLTVYLLLRQCTHFADDFSTAFKLSQANCIPRLLHSIDHTSPGRGWLVGLICTYNSFNLYRDRLGLRSNLTLLPDHTPIAVYCPCLPCVWKQG